MKKYTVKVDRPKISSEEIARRKDFNQLLQQYNRYKRKKPYFKTNAFLITIVTIVSVLLIAIALYYTQLVRLKHASPAKTSVKTEQPGSFSQASSRPTSAAIHRPPKEELLSENCGLIILYCLPSS